MTSDPWEKVLRMAVEEYLDWHKAGLEEFGQLARTGWYIYAVYPYKVREIMRERAISAHRYDEVLSMIEHEFSQAKKIAEITQRLLKS